MSNVRAGGNTVSTLSIIDAGVGGGAGDIVRQDIIFSMPNPVYVNENTKNQNIIYTSYVNQI